MKILGIESTGKTASCAISENDMLICEFSINKDKTHSEKLMPLIVKTLEESDVELKDINAIAISKGPGSYTGVRIGASIAKGLAQAFNLPILSIPTMKALAANIFDESRLIVPIVDGKSKRIYTGIYKWENGNLISIKRQFASDLDDLLAELLKLEQKIVFNGDGSVAYRKDIANVLENNACFAPMNYNLLKASSLNFLGYEMLKKGEITDCYDFKPEYLRASQAERMREK